ncbi:hypothetical protein ACF3NR_02965 [Vaginella massiliensis]|uniref:hypothetical protein n=1 Tax=Vaginella massiliensis TaxID=1816680 RepID=UPI003753E1F7
MNIHSTFKQFIICCMLLFTSAVFAQVQQTVTFGDNTDYNYSVDTDPEHGEASPDGTPGSTYAWSISGGGTFPTGQHNTIDNDNKATINWSGAAPGIYTITVEETNAGCSTDPVNFQVEVVLPNATGSVSWDGVNVCKGGVVTFNVTGAVAKSTLHYTVTNATDSTGTIAVDPEGKATIKVTHTDNNEVVITLDKMVLNNQDIPFPDTKPTATATINIVKTSPIILN